MRFIHTADWHLGRVFYDTHLTDDQAFALEGLHDLARDVRPDAIVVAGDVYDRAVPPPEAVALLDETLTRLVREVGCPVVVIAGNHDNPERIGFGSALLAEEGLHLAGPFAAEPVCVRVPTGEGTLAISAVPYAEPPVVREAYGEPEIRGHAGAMAAILDRIRAARKHDERTVLVAHAFVTGASVSESERPLSVGGAGTVPVDVFDGFDYVALGHLHSPQTAGSERVRYAGSLLKYSFGEASQRKSVSVVELSGDAVRVEEHTLPLRRDVRCIRSTIADIEAGPHPPTGREDYVRVELLDEEPVYNAIGRLREVYPNVMDVTRPLVLPSADAAAPSVAVGDLRSDSDEQLFAGFFSYVTGEELSDTEMAVLRDVIGARMAEEREA